MEPASHGNGTRHQSNDALQENAEVWAGCGGVKLNFNRDVTFFSGVESRLLPIIWGVRKSLAASTSVRPKNSLAFSLVRATLFLLQQCVYTRCCGWLKVCSKVKDV